MSGRYVLLAAVFVFAACATAAPAPEPAEAPPPPARDAAVPVQDAAVPAPDMPQDMGRMHRGGMMGDTAGATGRGMGGMHHRREGGEGMGMGRMGPTELREVPADLQEGERIYRETCSLCHTMDPPANLAPPMSHVARHLRQSFADEESAVAHVVDYLPAPAAERSIMPEMARERFGLMPPQPIPRNLLEAVGRYVWFLGSPQ
ncbi:MAG TPA: hypothetical protein VLA43_02755 [Longimicrobiales bacterium]|nr:hypothetical protein [Longimicrobiales bacterium]